MYLQSLICFWKEGKKAWQFFPHLIFGDDTFPWWFSRSEKMSIKTNKESFFKETDNIYLVGLKLILLLFLLLKGRLFFGKDRSKNWLQILCWWCHFRNPFLPKCFLASMQLEGHCEKIWWKNHCSFASTNLPLPLLPLHQTALCATEINLLHFQQVRDTKLRHDLAIVVSYNGFRIIWSK